jgi:N12 class adenine-specific DNA methylase
MVTGRLIDVDEVLRAGGYGPYAPQPLAPNGQRANPFDGLGTRVDPASEVKGVPPNWGNWMLPHVLSFTGVVGSISKVYRASDEALKDSYDNARLMRNDLVVMECVENRQRAVALLNWHIEPEDEKDQVQKQLGSDITAIIKKTPRFMQYRENLLHAVFFGRAGVAHRWRWKQVQGDWRICLDAWKPVHGDKIAFRYDPDQRDWQDDQIGIRVGTAYQAGNLIGGRWPVEKTRFIQPTDFGLAYFLRHHERPLIGIHKHYIEDGEYDYPQNAGRIHGVGIRSRIYWVWYQKQETLAWLMEYMERSAGGFEIWYYPWGNPQAKADVKKAATERVGLGRNIVMVPKMMGADQFGQWYDRIEPSMAGAEALKSIVTEYFGHQIKRYILGQTLTTEQGSTGLGSNLADVHMATFFGIVRYDAQNLEETITTDLVNVIRDYNYPKYRGIDLRFRIDTDTEDAQEKLQAYQAAYQMGLKLRAQDIYDTIGAAAPAEGDTVLDLAAQQAAAQPQPMGNSMAGQLPGMPGMDAGGPPAPDGGPPDNGGGGGGPPPAPAPGNGERASYARHFDQAIERYRQQPAVDQEFEQNHPRNQDGKFARKGTGTVRTAREEKLAKQLDVGHAATAVHPEGKHRVTLLKDSIGWYLRHHDHAGKSTQWPDGKGRLSKDIAVDLGARLLVNRGKPEQTEVADVLPSGGRTDVKDLERTSGGTGPEATGPQLGPPAETATAERPAGDIRGTESERPTTGLSDSDGGRRAEGSGSQTRGGERPADSGIGSPAGHAADQPGGGVSGGAVGGGGGAGGRTSGGGKATGRVKRVLTQTPTAKAPTDLAAGNWQYHDTNFFSSGKKSKFRDNVAAIRTLKTMSLEGRTAATPAEQETISKFVGWGQFPELFKYSHGGEWSKEQDEFKALVTDEEYKSARDSTINSHYTHPDVIKAHWQISQRLGFKGGRYLEPAVGAGYYLGFMPPALRGTTRVTAVEKEPLSGSIAKALYPASHVVTSSFEQHATPDNFYDMTGTNVPFADKIRPHDPRYKKFHANLHDYYFLRSADTTKPGGLVVHITSTGTLDKPTPMVRAELEKKLEFVGALRFPGETHQANAGTSVVTDMLMFRKRIAGLSDAHPTETPADAQAEPGFTGITTDSLGRLYHWQDGKRVPGPKWDDTVEVPDPAGGAPIAINRYFAEHPEQMLGTLNRTGTMYGGEEMNVERTDDYEARLQAAIDRLPKDILRTDSHSEQGERQETDQPHNPGAYVVQDGQLFTHAMGALTPVSVPPDKLARIEGQLAIRDAARQVLAAQRHGEDVTDARVKLNALYDEFTAEHGALAQRKNVAAMKGDPDAPFLLSLENRSGKNDIFSKDTVRKDVPHESAETVGEAAGIVLHETGRLDLDRMASLLGAEQSDVGAALVEQGLGYEDPASGWTPAATYLSGNVRRKLIEAKAAAANDPEKYGANVKALEEHQPEDVEYQDIGARLGAPWIPADDMQQFAAEMIGTDPRDFHIRYVPETAEWITGYRKGSEYLKGSRSNVDVWGVRTGGQSEGPLQAEFGDLLEHAMSGKKLVIRHKTKDANDVYPVDQEATEAAATKIQELKDRFREWVWEDESRRDRLHRFYNDNYNNVVPEHFDGTHLTFPGMKEGFEMRQAQKGFVWRVVTTGKGLAAHEVGTGKTASMVAAAMELRRLGLAKKPAIAVLKNNIEQITAEAQDLYPNAKILSTNDMFSAAKRQETLNRIATGDYDLVVMTHDHMNAMGMTKDTIAKYMGEEIEELEAAMLAAWEENPQKDNRIVKRMAKAKQALEADLAEALAQDEKDKIFFENTGIDQLFVDESHHFKSLPCYTSGDQVKGVPAARSQRATAMLARARYLQEHNGGRGVVFATGTPIGNTMAELYNMQRYLQPKELEERGVKKFDAWKGTYGETVNSMEFTLDGDMRPVSRFSEFVNLPELRHVSSEMMDVQRADNMLTGPEGRQIPAEAKPTEANFTGITVDKGGREYKWEKGKTNAIIRPKRHDHMVISEESPETIAMMADITRRAQAIKGKRFEKGGDSMFSIIDTGKKGSVDLRLIDPDAPDHPGSKANRAVAKILELYQAHPGQTQAVFSNVGVHPKKGAVSEEGDDEEAELGFSVFHDMIDKLVAGGIPREKIANFTELEGAARLEAEKAMRTGQVAIGFGSTKKLGTGTNVQHQLMAIHHLDVPYLPADIEQRNGRGWRSGNTNKDLDIFTYVQQGSLDHALWQIVARKAGFINQYMLGSSARTMRDEDTESMTPEQLMAVASGDENMLERVNVEADVKRLRSAKDRHSRDQERLRKSIAEAIEKDAPALVTVRDKHVASGKHFEARPDFSLKLGDREHTERGKELTEAFQTHVTALQKQLEEAKSWEREPLPVGEYRGAKLTLREDGFLDIEVPGGHTYTSGATLGSVESTVRGIGKRAEEAAEKIQRRKAEVETMKSQVGKPFRYETELGEKEARMKELTAKVHEKRHAQHSSELARDETP